MMYRRQPLAIISVYARDAAKFADRRAKSSTNETGSAESAEPVSFAVIQQCILLQGSLGGLRAF
nr:hypothetical protein A6C57_11910 [Fibrella sp. ES10-3-2-2]